MFDEIIIGETYRTASGHVGVAKPETGNSFRSQYFVVLEPSDGYVRWRYNGPTPDWADGKSYDRVMVAGQTPSGTRNPDMWAKRFLVECISKPRRTEQQQLELF